MLCVAYYSFVGIAREPVCIDDPLILLDTGFNVFTAHTNDLDGLVKRLTEEGVTVKQTFCLSDHEPSRPEDLLLPGQSSPLSFGSNEV